MKNKFFGMIAVLAVLGLLMTGCELEQDNGGSNDTTTGGDNTSVSVTVVNFTHRLHGGTVVGGGSVINRVEVRIGNDVIYSSGGLSIGINNQYAFTFQVGANRFSETTINGNTLRFVIPQLIVYFETPIFGASLTPTNSVNVGLQVRYIAGESVPNHVFRRYTVTGRSDLVYSGLGMGL